MIPHLPITQELLLIGGGHTHALVLRMWGMKPLPGVRVTVINPLPTAPYSGMLPGFVAGHYSRDELDIDLVKLARFAGARLVAGRACAIDTTARHVTLEDGRRLPYHVASVDIGITSEMPDMPGFAEHAIPAKPLDRFAATWAAFRASAAQGDAPPRAAVIGGGIAGIELALAMMHALSSKARHQPEMTLIDRANILPGMAPSRLEFFRKALNGAGIRVIEGDAPVQFAPGRITLASGMEVAADYTVGAAGAKPQPWPTQSGLETHEGFISVDETLRSLNTPDVFAVGDCAHLSHAPRPKAGVFAVREAPVLFANLRAALSDGTMQRFRPQKDYLKLISLGGRQAAADKWGMMWHGPRLWRLKDRIDQKFMNQFRTLKPMAQPPLPAQVAKGVRETLGDVPLCGGCGAKLGAGALARAIAPLPTPNRDDILAGAGDDAAVLAGPEGSYQVISTDHLRAFTEDPALMAQIAATHALGDIWAMGAAPQAALATVTLPRLSSELQGAWLAEIMGAANTVFGKAGAAIVGGHSAQGGGLAIGFTVTGLRTGRIPIGKHGARPGDWLILSKPIGTGVILAAEMRLQARGEWVLGAYDSMLEPLSEAARILAPHAHAMTDVTGFGLAGHLLEMAQASQVAVAVDLGSVPLLPGAVELAQKGVRSSLWPDNRAALPDLALPDDARADLLFDPQTAGGLLAAVSPDDGEALLIEMARAGLRAQVIGICREGSAGVGLI